MKKLIIFLLVILTQTQISYAADDYNVNEGTDRTVRADEVSGKLYQVIKLALGADGVVDTILAAGQKLMSSSVPVVVASDQLWTKEITWLTNTVYAESSIGSSYSAALTNSDKKVLIILTNDTDADLWISFDGTNNHYKLRAGFEKTFTIGELHGHETGNVNVKYVTNPSAGNLEITAAYTN